MQRLFILFIIFSFFCYGNLLRASTYYSIASGNWTSSSSWSLSSGGVAVSTGYPGVGDDVIIEGGYTITILNGATTLYSRNVTIGRSTAGTLRYSGGVQSLVLTGDLTVGGTSAMGTLDYDTWGLTISCARLLKGAGSAFIDNGLSQDFTFTGTFTLDPVFNKFRNFIINGGIVTLSSDIETNGSISPYIYSGSTLDLGTYQMTIGGYKNFKIYGTLIVGGPNNFPSTYETLVIDPNSTVKYNYIGNQNIYPLDYGNLVISGGGVKCTTGIISSLTIANSGSGYENDRGLKLDFSGGGGSGASGTLGVDDNEGDYTNIDGDWVLTDPNPNYGEISSAVLTSFGSGYTSIPSVSIVSDGGYIMGSGASITAAIRNTYTALTTIREDGALFCGETPSSSLIINDPSATLTTCLGVASSAVSFGVTGSGLTASVTITAPSNYEIASTINGTYATSLVLDVTSGTVSRTLFARLTASAITGTQTGTITASSTGASNATTTITGTVHSHPVLSTTAITICKEGSFLLTTSNAGPVENGWTITGSNAVNKNGYITAGNVEGSYVVSYTNACFLTSSATVTVVDASANTVADVTGGVPSYKFDGTAKGPVANIYVGYNGFTYSSESQPTGRGFYRANQVSGNSAGCPYSFSVFKCSNCPIVIAPVLSIGEAYGGGIVAYIFQSGDHGYVAGEQHGLIISNSLSGRGDVQWGTVGSPVTQTSEEIGYGLTNTDRIIDVLNDVSKTNTAAGLARSYNGGGYTDWYLPTFKDLQQIFINRFIIDPSESFLLNGPSNPSKWSSSTAINDVYSAWAVMFTSDPTTTIPQLIDCCTGPNDGRNSLYRVHSVRNF
jgi:hypothetical protein